MMPLALSKIAINLASQKNRNWAWQFILTVPAFGRLKQENYLQFVAILGSKVNSTKKERDRETERDRENRNRFHDGVGSSLTRLKSRYPQVPTRSFMKLSGKYNPYSLQPVTSMPSSVDIT